MVDFLVLVVLGLWDGLIKMDVEEKDDKFADYLEHQYRYAVGHII
jgi:hypothetical protein